MNVLVEKLIDLIQQWIGFLLPWFICGDDQCGVVRRLGLYRRDLKHGWNWKIPLLESVLSECSALDSTTLREQSLTTSDERPVTLRGVIAYRVIDPKRYILDCATAVSVLNDVGCCVIADVVPQLTLQQVLHGDVSEHFLRPMRRRAKKWGIDVESVGLVDRVSARTYRIINTTTHSRADDVQS